MPPFISFNSDSTIPQPAALKEEIVRQAHDRISVNGTLRRIWLADKHQATMVWNALTQTQYNQLKAYLYNQANSVIYSNSGTGLTFTGFPTTSEDNYFSGGSWLKNVSTTLLEI